jgi:hypothetical protein
MVPPSIAAGSCLADKIATPPIANVFLRTRMAPSFAALGYGVAMAVLYPAARHFVRVIVWSDRRS